MVKFSGPFHRAADKEQDCLPRKWATAHADFFPAFLEEWMRIAAGCHQCGNHFVCDVDRFADARSKSYGHDGFLFSTQDRYPSEASGSCVTKSEKRASSTAHPGRVGSAAISAFLVAAMAVRDVGNNFVTN